MGGSIQGRLWPRDDEEAARAVAQGYDLNQILKTEDLVKVVE
jgi:fructose-1,6-bisphosphatase II